MAQSTPHLNRFAVIGYGPQGRALAMNLRDSGYDLTIGLREGSASRQKAHDDKFASVAAIAEAVTDRDVIAFAFPDHRHAQVWEESIRDAVRPGQVLWFLHGTSIHFGFIEPPADVDVVMVAPHAPGNAVRDKFLLERDLSAFVAVYQDASGRATARARQIAAGCGFADERLIETTFKEEAIGDLFGEQVVLCGGLAGLIHAGFQTLVDNGHDPEHAYLEVAYQIDLIVELLKKFGISGMLDRISVAARYGSVETGPSLINEAVRQRMADVYRSIAGGDFAENLKNLSDNEIQSLQERYTSLTSPSFEAAARRFSSEKD